MEILTDTLVDRILPQTHEQFDELCERIFSEYKIEDHPSYREAIATAILHVPAEKDSASIEYFGKIVRKRIASQVAYAKMKEIQAKEEAEKEKLKLQLENHHATPPAEPSSGQSIQDKGI